jgi:hypothetical protein
LFLFSLNKSEGELGFRTNLNSFSGLEYTLVAFFFFLVLLFVFFNVVARNFRVFKNFYFSLSCRLEKSYGITEFLENFFCLFFVFFRQGFSVCSPGCPGTHSVDQTGLGLRNPPASASQVLGLKVCAITAWPFWKAFMRIY